MTASETLDYYWTMMQIVDAPEVFAELAKHRRQLIKEMNEGRVG